MFRIMDTQKMIDVDAIVVPGGGLTEKGDLPDWVRARVYRAVELQQQARYIITLSGNTVHKPPPLDAEGFPQYESVVAAKRLLEYGIAPERLLYETVSLDTIGNAYFTLLLHVLPLRLRSLHVITSAFHLPRTEAIFHWVFNLEDIPHNVQLTYEAVEDVGIEENVLAARKEREAKGLERVLRLERSIRTLRDFHIWLYTEHDAYAIHKQPQREKGIAQATY